jgi:hypothetical protein
MTIFFCLTTLRVRLLNSRVVRQKNVAISPAGPGTKNDCAVYIVVFCVVHVVSKESRWLVHPRNSCCVIFSSTPSLPSGLFPPRLHTKTYAFVISDSPLFHSHCIFPGQSYLAFWSGIVTMCPTCFNAQEFWILVRVSHSQNKQRLFR